MSEEDTLPAKKLVGIFAAVVVFGCVLGAVAAAVLEARESQLRPGHRFPERNLARQDRVANIRTELFDEVPPEMEENGYAWVDRDKGLVRIPIEQAMDLVAKGMRPQ